MSQRGSKVKVDDFQFSFRQLQMMREFVLTLLLAVLPGCYGQAPTLKCAPKGAHLNAGFGTFVQSANDKAQCTNAMNTMASYFISVFEGDLLCLTAVNNQFEMCAKTCDEFSDLYEYLKGWLNGKAGDIDPGGSNTCNIAGINEVDTDLDIYCVTTLTPPPTTKVAQELIYSLKNIQYCVLACFGPRALLLHNDQLVATRLLGNSNTSEALGWCWHLRAPHLSSPIRIQYSHPLFFFVVPLLPLP